MDKNIIDFPSNITAEPTEPDHHVYEVMVRTPDGGSVIVNCEGYLVATSAFIGICQGPYSKSEFHMIAPMDSVVYSKSIGPVRFTGKLSS